LPIIETQAGDISDYIPTNVISITDGQIFVEQELFNSGQRPAMNAGISVSRVGGNAQVKSMRSTSGTLKLELAQYREVEAFAQFGSDLDQATRDQLANGERLTMILRQGQYAPLSVEEQVVQLYAATPQEARTSWVRRIPAADVPRYGGELLSYMKSKHPQVLDDLRTSGAMSDEITEKLNAALDEFGKVFEPSGSVD